MSDCIGIVVCLCICVSVCVGVRVPVCVCLILLCVMGVFVLLGVEQCLIGEAQHVAT